ncbi:MAG: ABC transporter permease [Acidimicrobiales bacterium]
MLAYTRFEVVRILRNKRYVIFTIGLPLAFYFIYSSIYAKSHFQGTTFAAYYMVSMASFAAFGAALGAGGTRLAMERKNGWIHQLRITPLSAAGWLGTKLAAALAVAVPCIAVVLIAGVAAHGVSLPAARWAQLVVSLVLATIPFGIMGMVVGYLFDEESAQAGQTIILLGVSILGGLWFPLSIFPHALQEVAKFTPSYGLGAVGRAALVGQGPGLVPVVGLVAWTVVLGVALAFLYRRTETRAVA